METILYLIRHGETAWNQLRRIQGHSDIALNETGEKQAEKMALYLAPHSFKAIYSSDLQRALATANHLSAITGVPVTALASLRERYYGQLEGLTFEEVKKRLAVADEASYGAEPFKEALQRAVKVLTELAEKHLGDTIAVVSHGGFINSFLHHVTGGKQGTGITRLENTGVNLFRYKDKQWEVIKVNDTKHLQR
ncbi:histidine phosphatase family protein [Brevibacillus fulvus]|uniref:Phosphoglycerate mutase/uncharacterized phosphatase n=1 Tax=Brevibacillus fulvus TaxID=1125967 RepID=A0A938XZ08_9BACL|nr:histidine phosphatase family protein [Brevibacillus fulvus]MBM7590799.1 putative phosphoglycerate mutase/uncharacterized phosphatase [Brevibacillus fulvus]